MIHRAENRQFYTIVAGETINDANLSMEALGLLVRMLALNDEWLFSIEGLTRHLNIGRTKLLRCMKELEDAGYLEIFRVKDKNGKFTFREWHVFEISRGIKNRNTEFGNTENRNTENHNTENRNTENVRQTNINITNINKTNIKVTNNKEAHGEFKNVLMTSEQFDKLGERLGAEERDGLIEELSCYLQNHPRKYKDHYATVLSWARKREAQPKGRTEPLKERTFTNPFTELKRKEGFF